MTAASYVRTETFAPEEVPLCVDLDGTLLRSDLLFESCLQLIRENWLWLFLMPLWLLRGRAYLKQQVAQRVVLDVESLPYDQEVLSWIREQRHKGRYVVLATGANCLLAQQVADQLRCFDDVVASDRVNLTGEQKCDVLVARYGDHGFDYAGDSSADVKVWSKARMAIPVGASPSVIAAAERVAVVGKRFHRKSLRFGQWLKAIRVRQWLKNLLVFVPALGSHRMTEPAVLMQAVTVFFAFSAIASAIYVINDLLDLPADRRHKRKRSRALASGSVSIPAALLTSVLLLITGFALGSQLSAPAQVVLVVYSVLSNLYSIRLKLAPVIDVSTLSMLYTMRIIAGAAACDISLSLWLVALSMFVFLSLAFSKRSSELLALASENKTQPSRRGYTVLNLELLNIAGVCSALVAGLVLILYAASGHAHLLYSTPHLLWLSCPVLVYWLLHIWMVTLSGDLHEDPLLFATRDKVSYLSGVALLLVFVAARYLHIPLLGFAS